MNDAMSILVAAVAILGLFLLVAVLWRWSKSRKLQRDFGPEYDHTLRTAGDRKAAERELLERKKRVESYQLRQLTPEERRDFGARWRGAQVDFVDRPQQAVEAADRLIVEVMIARGYPQADHHQRIADVSVENAHAAAEYREARSLAERSRHGEANTEDLRRAMVLFRDQFQVLLGPEEVPTVPGPEPARSRIFHRN